MKILIADDLKIYRLALRLYIHKDWPEAVIYEADNMYEVAGNVFDVEFDLMILDINMPGNELLEEFVSKAIKYTKVVIFSDLYKDDPRVSGLIKIGAHAFIPKTYHYTQIISTLQFLFNETNES